MEQIKLKAMAKINLGLDVIGKREDGYHEVRMIMQTIHLYDQIFIRKTNNPGISVKTNLYYLPVNENNLVHKAASMLMEEFGIEKGVFIHLKKHIPVAAGMAGGSADGAAVLYGMNRLFNLGLSMEELMERGVKLGADVPYCLIRGTALAEGIGEKLTSLPPMPQCFVLIVKPNFSVSTKFVYGNLKVDDLDKHPDIDGIIEAIQTQDLYRVADKLENVLETVTIQEYPMIGEIKQEMINKGAMNALMSGSGPTVFGLFDNEKKARKAYMHFKMGNWGKQVYLTKLFNSGGKRMYNDFQVSMDEYLPLRDVVFNTLRQAILKGELKPGERLMEIQLANRLGVSRTPIREAIRKLELEGLVIMIPRKGAQVAKITAKNLKDVLEVRLALEQLAIQLACRNAGPEHLNKLEEASVEFENAVSGKDVTVIADADINFHEIIYEATGNLRLIQILNNLREQMYRYRVEYLKDHRSHSGLVAEHAMIVNALKNQDPDKATEVMSAHIENQEKTIMNNILENE